MNAARDSLKLFSCRCRFHLLFFGFSRVSVDQGLVIALKETLRTRFCYARWASHLRVRAVRRQFPLGPALALESGCRSLNNEDRDFGEINDASSYTPSQRTAKPATPDFSHHHQVRFFLLCEFKDCLMGCAMFHQASDRN